jgi:hypothetical protein
MGFVAYVFVLASVLPRIFLRARLGNGSTSDRGVKKYKFEDGRAVVYEPESKIRRYVNQYVLVDKSGDKYLKCKIDKRVSTIKYDVVVFDGHNNAIDVIQISEAISSKGYTVTAELPRKTSYVSLILREINYYPIDKSPFAYYKPIQILLFVVANVLTTVSASLVLRGFINKSLETFGGDTIEGVGFAVISATVVGLISALLIFLCNYSRGVKISSK